MKIRRTNNKITFCLIVLRSIVLIAAFASILLSHVVFGQDKNNINSQDDKSTLLRGGTLPPLSAANLTRIIDSTDSASETNSLLLDQASNMSLQQAAYDEYNKLYMANQDGFYENLWLGKGSWLLGAFISRSRSESRDQADNLYSVAEKCLKHALALRPHSALAEAFLGHLEFRYLRNYDTDDDREPIAMMRQAVQDDPMCADAHILLAEAYSDSLNDGDWYLPQAEQREYQKALKLRPLSASNLLALIHVAISNWDKRTAQDAMAHLSALAPGDPKIVAEMKSDSEAIAGLPDTPLPLSPEKDPNPPTPEDIIAQYNFSFR